MKKKIKPDTTAPKKKGVFIVFDEFIENRKQEKSENTIKTYRTFKNHLEKFSNEMKFQLSFENINLNFYDELLAYFFEKNFYNSTIGKYVTILKTFMNWAGERRFHNNMEFKKFLVFKDDSEKIKLKPEIVEKLRTTDFEDEYSNIVRDIFILSSYTGLRFVDIQNMRPEDVTENFLRLHIKKAKEMLDIPLLDVPKEIIRTHIERYGTLKVPTNQYCNREIKKLFKAIGFEDKIRFVKYSGSTEITVEKHSHDYLTMHYEKIKKYIDENFIYKGTGKLSKFINNFHERNLEFDNKIHTNIIPLKKLEIIPIIVVSEDFFSNPAIENYLTKKILTQIKTDNFKRINKLAVLSVETMLNFIFKNNEDDFFKLLYNYCRNKNISNRPSQLKSFPTFRFAKNKHYTGNIAKEIFDELKISEKNLFD